MSMDNRGVSAGFPQDWRGLKCFDCRIWIVQSMCIKQKPSNPFYKSIPQVRKSFCFNALKYEADRTRMRIRMLIQEDT
jgi:hypothetical protein